jgi:hydrogenase maturation protein HypF
MIPQNVLLEIRGTVQGVGFRPFVYREALKRHLRGKVWNTSQGVSIIASGLQKDIASFIDAVRRDFPPLAAITHIKQSLWLETVGANGFSIEESALGEQVLVDITRDTAVCGPCVSELFDVHNRRYRNPFITCTDCGPRFSIITALPYDRARTTMAHFPLCPECAREFHDPADRRFHAQPICCNHCGPSLELRDVNGMLISTGDPVTEAIDLLARGKILAIKGLGGFHLACRADSDKVVQHLRERKGREEKPFACMVKNSAAAGKYVVASPGEIAILESIERPIVILPENGSSPLSPLVAPGLSTLGIMLPCTPLQHLLFAPDAYTILIMTSANSSGEPICKDTGEAVVRLRGIADGYLTHTRGIHIRMDDSIARVMDDKPVLLRRARGYVPAPLPADSEVDGIVGLGGIMKSTLTVGRGSTCYVSHYLGVADTIPVLDQVHQTLNHFLSVLAVNPRKFVCDMHPAGLVHRLAFDCLPLVKVQHHHAHAVACMAENRLHEQTICVIYDGMGLGDDNTIWGGEILLADRATGARIGHCLPIRMPGADSATIFPGRLALAALYNHPGIPFNTLCPWMNSGERAAVTAMLDSSLVMPYTSSMGRLFDACAALLDVCRRQTYEGQAAIELEGIAARDEKNSYPGTIAINESGRYIIDGPQILSSAFDDYMQGTERSVVAARFHNTIADLTVSLVELAADRYHKDAVCFSGGCFQNRLLFERTVSSIRKKGLRPYVHRLLSPGDECVSYGQVIIASEKGDF